MSQLLSDNPGSPSAQKIHDEVKNHAHNAEIRKMKKAGVYPASIQIEQRYLSDQETTRKTLYSEKAIGMVCEGIESISQVKLKETAPVAMPGESARYLNDRLGFSELRVVGERGGRLASWLGDGVASWRDCGASAERPLSWNSRGMPGCPKRKASPDSGRGTPGVMKFQNRELPESQDRCWGASGWETRPFLQDGRLSREYPQGGFPPGVSEFRGGGMTRIQNGEIAGRQSCGMEGAGQVQLGGGRMPEVRQWDGSWKLGGGIVSGIMERRPSDRMFRMTRREGWRDQCEAKEYGEIMVDHQITTTVEPSRTFPLNHWHSLSGGFFRGANWFASANAGNRKRRMTDRGGMHYCMDSVVPDNRLGRHDLVKWRAPAALPVEGADSAYDMVMDPSHSRCLTADRGTMGQWYGSVPTRTQAGSLSGAVALTSVGPGEIQRDPQCAPRGGQLAHGISIPSIVPYQRRGPPGLARWQDGRTAGFQHGRRPADGGWRHGGRAGQWDQRLDGDVHLCSNFQPLHHVSGLRGIGADCQGSNADNRKRKAAQLEGVRNHNCVDDKWMPITTASRAPSSQLPVKSIVQLHHRLNQNSSQDPLSDPVHSRQQKPKQPGLHVQHQSQQRLKLELMFQKIVLSWDIANPAAFGRMPSSRHLPVRYQSMAQYQEMMEQLLLRECFDELNQALVQEGGLSLTRGEGQKPACWTAVTVSGCQQCNTFTVTTLNVSSDQVTGQHVLRGNEHKMQRTPVKRAKREEERRGAVVILAWDPLPQSGPAKATASSSSEPCSGPPTQLWSKASRAAKQAPAAVSAAVSTTEPERKTVTVAAECSTKLNQQQPELISPKLDSESKLQSGDYALGIVISSESERKHDGRVILHSVDLKLFLEGSERLSRVGVGLKYHDGQGRRQCCGASRPSAEGPSPLGAVIDAGDAAVPLLDDDPPAGRWRILFLDCALVTSEREFVALHCARLLTSRFQKTLLGNVQYSLPASSRPLIPESGHISVRPLIVPPGTGLNMAQEAAARAAIDEGMSDGPFTLIQGPPGTGKTQTILCILASLRDRGARSLVCAPSNNAVDEIAVRLFSWHNAVAPRVIGGSGTRLRMVRVGKCQQMRAGVWSSMGLDKIMHGLERLADFDAQLTDWGQIQMQGSHRDSDEHAAECQSVTSSAEFNELAAADDLDADCTPHSPTWTPRSPSDELLTPIFPQSFKFSQSPSNDNEVDCWSKGSDVYCESEEHAQKYDAHMKALWTLAAELSLESWVAAACTASRSWPRKIHKIVCKGPFVTSDNVELGTKVTSKTHPWYNLDQPATVSKIEQLGHELILEPCQKKCRIFSENLKIASKPDPLDASLNSLGLLDIKIPQSATFPVLADTLSTISIPNFSTSDLDGPKPEPVVNDSMKGLYYVEGGMGSSRGLRSSAPKNTHSDSVRELRGKKKLVYVEIEDHYSSGWEVKPNWVINTADVVFATLSGTGGAIFKQSTPFDFVLIDEAAQAVEPASLAPLTLVGSGVHAGKSCRCRCVLVGDPQQLPPTVMSSASKKMLYNRSLFERLQKAGLRMEVLTTQYRMQPQIRQFPSDHFYRSMLVDGVSISSRKPPVWASDVRFGPFVLYDIPVSEQLDGPGSLFNAGEARFCVNTLKTLEARFGTHCVLSEKVVILTPYRRQVQEINRMLKSESLLSYTVCTIDSFQGREAEMIILSCVRGDSSGQLSGIGFLADVRRMNVALTRARASLLVLCNANSVIQNPNWQALVEYAQRTSSYVRVADGTGSRMYFASTSNHRRSRGNGHSKKYPSSSHTMKLPPPPRPMHGKTCQRFISAAKLTKGEAAKLTKGN